MMNSFYKYNGKAIKGKDFYNLLFESNEFLSNLGKSILLSGELERTLISFIERKKSSNPEIKIKDFSTLGSLIKVIEKHNLLDENKITALDILKKQRNYFSHNIYSLFDYKIQESILERENLVDADVELYIERVLQLNENLKHIIKILKKC